MVRFLQQLLQHSTQSLDSLLSTTACTLHGLVWLERLIPQPYIQRLVRLEDRTHLPNSNLHIRSLLKKHHYMGRLPSQRYPVLKSQGLELLQACLTPAQKIPIRTNSTANTKMLVLCPNHISSPQINPPPQSLII